MFFCSFLLASDDIKFTPRLLADISEYVVEGRPDFQRIKEAATRRKPVAECALAVCYLQNIGAKRGIDEVFRLMKRSADAGYPEACKNLSILLGAGLGTGADSTESIRYLTIAAEAGNHEAERILGIHYAYGITLPKNYCKATKWFNKAIDGGDQNTSATIASLFMMGWGANLLPNAIEAFIRYRKALNMEEARFENLHVRLKKLFDEKKKKADTEDSAAQCVTGCLYHYGIGVELDDLQAYRYMEQAERSNNLEALYNKAFFLLLGLGIEQDIRTAFSTFLASATRGFASAKRVIGELYLRGIGDTFGCQESISLYGRSCFTR